MQAKLWPYLFFILILNVSCEEYYIVPTESQTSNCSVSPYLTLSEFVRNQISLIDPNTTLHFAAGSHTLDGMLAVTNVNNFSMLSVSNEDVFIKCEQFPSRGYFWFTNANAVYMRGLKFINCVGNQLKHVSNVSIHDSMFMGEYGFIPSSLTVNKTRMNVTNTVFLSNRAKEYRYILTKYCECRVKYVVEVGGAMVLSASTVALNNCRFEDNKANVGGAIYSEKQSNITISNSFFTSNHVTDSLYYDSCMGGALYISERSAVTLHNCTFRNNTSTGYGSLAAVSYASLNISQSLIDNSTSDINGGTVTATYSTLTFTDTTFYNSRSKMDGGVVYLYKSCSLFINNCTFSNNTAYNGGVITARTRTTITIQTSVFVKNTAIMNGGVVHAESQCSINITNSLYSNNTANMNGGVVHAESQCSINITNSLYSNNTATFGGVLSAFNSASIELSNSNFSNNIAKLHGGVAYLRDNSSIVTKGCLFISNQASDSGGVMSGKNYCTMNFTNSFFIRNKAAEYYGGILIAQKDCTVLIENDSFNDNSAEFGGAFYVRKRSKIAIDNSTFKNNFAHIGGAVLFSRIQSSATINKCSFFSNSADNNGILHVSDHTNLTVNNSIFTDNQVTFNGGVTYAYYSCMILFRHCTFTNNSAQNCGGVVYGRDSSTIVIMDSAFYNCSSENEGGVVYVQLNSNVRIELSQFDYNTADIGGALVLFTGSSADIITSDFMNNKAILEGGALDASKNSVIRVSNSNFSFNMAIQGGVVSITQSSNFTISESNFSHNMADYGAVFRTFQGCVVVADRNTYQYNRAEYGGVLCSKQSKVTFKRSSIIQNIAYHKGGVMYVSNNNEINIIFNKFLNNKAWTYGGVIYIYDNSFSFIHGSNFTGNKALSNGGVISAIGSRMIIKNNNFSSSRVGNSGGVIYSKNSTFELFSSLFINNSAKDQQDQGPDSRVDTDLTLIEDCTRNSGGVIYLKDSSTCTIVKCKFLRSRADKCGGAISATTSSKVTILNSTLDESIVYPGTDDHVPKISSTHICSNIAKFGGGLYMSDSSLYIKTVTNISLNRANSSGGGIYAIRSSIFIINTFHFGANQAKNGGGVSLANSKMYDSKQQLFNVNFVSNLADYGGALYVYDETNSCSNDPYTGANFPENGCFFENVTKGLMMNFVDNFAYHSGNDLYGGLLDRCTVVSVTNLSRLESNGTTRFKHISNIKDFANISSKSVRVCLCKNNQTDCAEQRHTIKVKRGDRFTISVAAINQVEKPTIATIKSKFKDVYLSENQTSRQVGNSCSDLDYQASFPHAGQEYELFINAEGPCNSVGISELKVFVQVLSCLCPPGFIQNNLTMACICDCDSRLSSYIKRCNFTTESIIREGEFWISYLKEADNDTSFPYLIAPYCPLDYCKPPNELVYINLSDTSDVQCINNRGGILCGSCQVNFSLSLGSSKCIKCPKQWPGQLVGIIITAFVAGIILVILLLVFNVTVATGTLNSIIFYANIIDANKHLYFTESGLTFVPVFISWMNMDIGFDTCFYEGMDSYGKAWLQLLFPAYIFLLVIAIIFVSSCSFKFSNIIAKRDPVATLATLILLSYAKLLETTIISLSYVPLHYPNGTTVIRWQADATVDYGQGKHVALIILALSIIVIGLSYTTLIFSWQWLLRFSRKKLFRWTRNQRLHSFINTYHIPYNPQHRYWTGLLQLVRILVYLISTFSASVNPRIILLSIQIIMCCLLLYKVLLVVKPYKLQILDATESLILCNIVIFTGITWYMTEHPINSEVNKKNLQRIACYVFIGVVLLQFLLTIAYHVFRYGSTTLYSLCQSTNIVQNLNRPHLQDQKADLLASSDNYRLFETFEDQDQEFASYSLPAVCRDQKVVSVSISLSECEDADAINSQ